MLLGLRGQGDVTTSWLPGSVELDSHTWSHSGCVGSSAIGEHELKLSLRMEIPNHPTKDTENPDKWGTMEHVVSPQSRPTSVLVPAYLEHLLD